MYACLLAASLSANALCSMFKRVQQGITTVATTTTTTTTILKTKTMKKTTKTMKKQSKPKASTMNMCSGNKEQEIMLTRKAKPKAKTTKL